MPDSLKGGAEKDACCHLRVQSIRPKIMNKTILRREFNLVQSLNHLHPVLQRVYAARGIKSAQELDYRLQNLLHYQSLSIIMSNSDTETDTEDYTHLSIPP